MVYAPPLRASSDSTPASPLNDAPPTIATIRPGLALRHDNVAALVERSLDHNSGERQSRPVVMISLGLGVTISVDDLPPIVTGELEDIESPAEATAPAQKAEETTPGTGAAEDPEAQGQYQRSIEGATWHMTITQTTNGSDPSQATAMLFGSASLGGLRYTTEDGVNALGERVAIGSQNQRNHHEVVNEAWGSANTAAALEETQFIPHDGLDGATGVQTRMKDTVLRIQHVQPDILDAGGGQFQENTQIEAIENALPSWESRLQVPVEAGITSPHALSEHHIVRHDAKLQHGEHIKVGTASQPEEGVDLGPHAPLGSVSTQTATGPVFTGLPSFTSPPGSKLYQEDDNNEIETGNIEGQKNARISWADQDTLELSEHETVQEPTVDTNTHLGEDPTFVHWHRAKLSHRVPVKFKAKAPVQPRKNLLRDTLVNRWRRNKGDMNIINHFLDREGSRDEERGSSTHRNTSARPPYSRRRNPGILFISPENKIASPAVPPQAGICQSAYVEHPVIAEGREPRGGETPTDGVQAIIVRNTGTNSAPPLSLADYENWAWAWVHTPRVFTPVWQWFWLKWHFQGMTLRDAYPIGKWPRVWYEPPQSIWPDEQYYAVGSWFGTILSTPAGRRGKTSRLLSMWVHKYRLLPGMDTNPAPPEHSVEFLWYLHHLYADVFDRRALRIGHIEFLLTAEELGFYAHLGSFQMSRAQFLQRTQRRASGTT